MDGMLSQEEINALLNGMDSGDTSSDTTFPDAGNVMDINEVLSPMQRDTIGEISNISMGTAATTLSSLVNQKVDITTPQVEMSNWQDLVDQYARPCVFVQISYREGINGNNVFILKDTDVKIIADLMMGGNGTNIEMELGELQLSAICEAMNQMMGSASTSLSSMLGMKIDISPPIANLIDLNGVVQEEQLVEFLKGDFVKISFKMTVGDLVDSQIMQLYPVEFCKTLCNKFGVGSDDDSNNFAPEPVINAEPAAPQMPSEPTAAASQMQQPVPEMPPMMDASMNQQSANAMNMGYGMPQMQGMPMMQGMPQMQGMPMMQGMPQMQGMPMMQPVMPMQNVNVQQAQFQTFSPDLVAVNQKENINLIMDVPLEVTVELGRTSKSIQDILEFAPGTIIELNKLAGEPIDVLVNGKYVAKGEVVVIEESFGIRVTEIIR